MLFISKHLLLGYNIVHTSGSDYEVVNINICNTLNSLNVFDIGINIDSSNQTSIPDLNYIRFNNNINPLNSDVIKSVVLIPNTNIIINVTGIGLDVSIFGAEDA